MRRIYSFFILLIRCANSWRAGNSLVELNDAITLPAMNCKRALKMRASPMSQALVITMNTPGEVLMRQKKYLTSIQNSPALMVCYPNGATAWSAGTIILLATDVAAMAPNTIIGSAQPVEMHG